MKELIRKMGLLGIGLFALTEEKIKEVIEELEKKGELSKEEGKRFVKELAEERKKQKEEMVSMISKELEKVLKKAGIATSRDIEKLSEEIRQLREALGRE